MIQSLRKPLTTCRQPHMPQTPTNNTHLTTDTRHTQLQEPNAGAQPTHLLGTNGTAGLSKHTQAPSAATPLGLYTRAACHMHRDTRHRRHDEATPSVHCCLVKGETAGRHQWMCRPSQLTYSCCCCRLSLVRGVHASCLVWDLLQLTQPTPTYRQTPMLAKPSSTLCLLPRELASAHCLQSCCCDCAAHVPAAAGCWGWQLLAALDALACNAPHPPAQPHDTQQQQAQLVC
jgi:hypothetical protein